MPQVITTPQMAEVVAKVRSYPPEQQAWAQEIARKWAVKEGRLAEWESHFQPTTDIISHLLEGVAFYSKAHGFELIPVSGFLGPRVIVLRFKPGNDTRVGTIANRFDDIITRFDAITADPPPIVRPVSGGIEVLCVRKDGEICDLAQYVKPKKDWKPWHKFTLPVGVSVEGQLIEPVIVHMQLAGTPGSGKTVELNALLGGSAIQYKSQHVKWLLIDPERVGLRPFNGLARFWAGVDGKLPRKAIVDIAQSVAAIAQVLDEHERRLNMLESSDVADIERYNFKNQSAPLPHLMVVIDEYAVLLNSAGKALATEPEEGQKPLSEKAISDNGKAIVNGLMIEIGQRCRKTGIHLIIASQRADADTFNVNLRDNLATKIVLRCVSKGGSQVAFGYDCAWALQLAGNGDMWVVGHGAPQRAQGFYIDDETPLKDGRTRLERLLAAVKAAEEAEGA